MFADTLLQLEREHLLRLALWGATGILAGSAMLAILSVRRVRAPLLFHFGLQTAVWGAAIAGRAAIGWHWLAMRDLIAATRLDRLLWLSTGLDAGVIAVGATLAIAGWRWARRWGAVGAGVAIIVQGIALLVFDAGFAALLRGLV
jgi:hypothetical protein